MVRATLAALLFPAVAFAAPRTAELDGQVRFVSEAPLEKIVGTGEGKGSVTVDFDDLAATRGSIKVAVASMKTGNDQRDEHLRGTDWLDAAKYPEIVFTIESIEVKKTEDKEKYKEAELLATGDFSLHGVTTRLSAPVTVKWTGDKVKVETKFAVKLADYQVQGKQGVVGSKVGESIAIEGSLKGVAK